MSKRKGNDGAGSSQGQMVVSSIFKILSRFSDRYLIFENKMSAAEPFLGNFHRQCSYQAKTGLIVREDPDDPGSALEL